MNIITSYLGLNELISNPLVFLFTMATFVPFTLNSLLLMISYPFFI
nr:MAG TPA: hypothetical protein [Caudoviricetes sp.]